MIIYNCLMEANDMVKTRIMPNGDTLQFTAEHKLDSGWFLSVVQYINDEPDWGFCSGWRSNYLEALESLKSHPAYKKYPFFDLAN